jgi:hypothetical protein
MDTNKMREEIENWFMENVDCEDDHFFARDKARYFTKNLLSLLAPVFEAAELWEKVEELAAHYRHVGCAGCPEMNTKTGWCSGRCSTADAIVKALKEAP